LAILNITPDSFADGGRLPTPAHAADAARRAADHGADALDLGAESTRPGAARVPPDEQIRRLIPAIEAIRAAGIDLPMTVDTTLAPVARAALDAGADAINDVAAGSEDDAMLALAAERACAIVLMHRLAPPTADRYSDRYDTPPAYPAGVVPAVRAFLAERAAAARAAGVPADRILLDPGLGFGKSVEQNLELLNATPDLLALGHPVLSALSRKSFVGRLGLARDSDPAERLPATLALSVLHLHAGARVFRVHDVAEHRQALDAAWAALRA
jgi:dihydropteroate synthase